MSTIKSYKLKMYPNKGKIAVLDQLLEYWATKVQEGIDTFWDMPDEALKRPKPPYGYQACNSIIGSNALYKGWQLVKNAKKMGIEKPQYRGGGIDLSPSTIKFTDFSSTDFDFWVKVTTLEKHSRIMIPCKKHRAFNQAVLNGGKLRKSARLIKENGVFYLMVMLQIPTCNKNNTNILGIDVGLNHSIATSDGKIMGDELRNLRIRTKWRCYEGPTPMKQALNRMANSLIELYPDTNFALEDLLFKGKRKRNREFRRRNKNWAYKHLGKRLDQLSHVKGFSVIWVDPANTSITCPECGCLDKGNRNGDSFKCKACGYENHADVVGAINIASKGNLDGGRLAKSGKSTPGVYDPVNLLASP